MSKGIFEYLVKSAEEAEFRMLEQREGDIFEDTDMSEIDQESGDIDDMRQSLDDAVVALEDFQTMLLSIEDYGRKHSNFDRSMYLMYRNQRNSIYRSFGYPGSTISLENYDSPVVKSLEEEKSIFKKFYQGILNFIGKIADKVVGFFTNLNKLAGKVSSKAAAVNKYIATGKDVEFNLTDSQRSKYSKYFVTEDSTSVKEGLQRLRNAMASFHAKPVVASIVEFSNKFINITADITAAKGKKDKAVEIENKIKDLGEFYRSFSNVAPKSMGLINELSSAPEYVSKSFRKVANTKVYESPALPGNRKIVFARKPYGSDEGAAENAISAIQIKLVNLGRDRDAVIDPIEKKDVKAILASVVQIADTVAGSRKDILDAIDRYKEIARLAKKEASSNLASSLRDWGILSQWINKSVHRTFRQLASLHEEAETVVGDVLTTSKDLSYVGLKAANKAIDIIIDAIGGKKALNNIPEINMGQEE